MKLSRKSPLLFLLIVVTLSSCNLSNKNPLCASWKMVSTDGSGKEDSLMGGEFKTAYLRLYPNNQYTFLNLRRYAQGKWALSKNDSLLTIYGFSDAGNLVLKVSDADGDWIRGEIISESNNPSFLLKADPYFEYKDVDLLSPASNAWRQRPDHKESAAEIRARVIAHLDYMRQYFKIINEDDRPSFYPAFLHSPITFYSNGIGLKSVDDPPYVWIKVFYDQEDGRAGTRLIGQAIESINRYPKDKKTFTEGYYIALGEMEDYLKMIK